MQKLSETEKIALETAKIAIGELTKTYFDFCQTVWCVFNMGRQYEKAFSVPRNDGFCLVLRMPCRCLSDETDEVQGFV